MTWDRFKKPGSDGREMMRLRECSFWQSVLGLKSLPDIIDIHELARSLGK